MVDFTLTDEQKDLRELAHNFAEKEIRPVAWDYDRDGDLAAGDRREGLGSGPDEHPHRRGVRRARPRLPLRLPDRGGDGLGMLGHRHQPDGQRPRLGSGQPRRHRGGEEEVPRHAHRGAEARLLLPHRARRRLRRQRDEDHRHQERRQVGDQRLQVLHHQRRLRRLVHGLRQDRQGRRPPRYLRLRRPSRRDGDHRQEGGQARPARLQHRDRGLQRDGDPGRPPARARRTRASSWR